jgi:tRNA (adenine22-N1)-methyltransferase
MELGIRLNKIVSIMDKCECALDVGTDHAHIPIYIVKNNICNRAIASDINRGPVEKAKINVSIENLQDKIECRLGGGLSVIQSGEAQSAVIAGMGGNLIRDIIENDLPVFKSFDYLIAQPIQNPEIFRNYIYSKGYKIIDEELCIEDNKYYEIMKISYGQVIKKVDPIFYEISELLLNKRHPLIKDYICFKMNKYNKILLNITKESELAEGRKKQVNLKIKKLKELLICL